LGLNGIAMLIPLVYVLSSALDFANYELPDWTGWLGAGIFLVLVSYSYQAALYLAKMGAWMGTIRKKNGRP